MSKIPGNHSCSVLWIYNALRSAPYFLPDQEFSQTENRTLAQFPVFRWSNLADGHLLLPLLQRMADRGAERFSTSISLG